MKNHVILYIVCIVFLYSPVMGQSIEPDIINTIGSAVILGGNTYEISVGEMTAVNTASANNLVVTHGVLQPVEKTVGINSRQLSDNRIKVYPNPIVSKVTISFDASERGQLYCFFADVDGRSIIEYEKQVQEGVNIDEFDVSQLASGVYFLHITYEVEGGGIEEVTHKLLKIK